MHAARNEYASLCMKTFTILTEEHGFSSAMSSQAILEVGPSNISSCVEWMLSHGHTPTASPRSQTLPVEITTNGATLEQGGTIRNENVVKLKGNLHVDRHQFTFKNPTLEYDVWWCSHNRKPCNCKVALRHYRDKGKIDLYMRDGSKEVKHNEACSMRNAVRRNSLAAAASSASDVQQSAPPEFGKDVAQEAQQIIDELSINNLNMLPMDIWNQTADVMDSRYPNGWFGIGKDAAIRRVYTTRNNHFGKGDIYRTIEHPTYKNDPHSGQSFLQCNLTLPSDDPRKVDRIIGWAHPTLLLLLNGPVDLFIDATYKITPKIPDMYQCLIVMVKDQQTQYFAPVMYVLMSGKTKMMYFQVLHFLLTATDFKINPRRISCDNEEALVTQIEHQFPPTRTEIGEDRVVRRLEGTDLNTCLFHLKQAWRRKCKKMGIPEWQIRIAMERGMIDLLCVLPPDELRDKGIPFVMDLLFGRITKAKQDKKMTLKEVALWRSFFIGYIGGWWLDEKRIHTWSMYNKVSSKFDLYACMYQISHVLY
jgi:hypothetical protein